MNKEQHLLDSQRSWTGGGDRPLSHSETVRQRQALANFCDWTPVEQTEQQKPKQEKEMNEN